MQTIFEDNAWIKKWTHKAETSSNEMERNDREEEKEKVMTIPEKR